MRRAASAFGQGYRIWGLPLTLTLSPQAGRGDLPHESSRNEENVAAYLLRPACGEKVAGRPDEGLAVARTTGVTELR